MAAKTTYTCTSLLTFLLAVLTGPSTANAQVVGVSGFACGSNQVAVVMADGSVYSATGGMVGNISCAAQDGGIVAVGATAHFDCDRVWGVTAAGRIVASLQSNLGAWTCYGFVFQGTGKPAEPVVAGGTDGYNKVYAVTVSGNVFSVNPSNLFETLFVGNFGGGPTPANSHSWGSLKGFYR